MAPTGDAYEVDWILSNSSNAHVATHRDWFTTFTPFATSIYCGFPTDRCLVLGIGHVHLQVKTDPRFPGVRSHRTLVLHDVLYCPDLATNILGGHIHNDFPLGEATTRLVDLSGEAACMFDRVDIHEPGLRTDHKRKLWLHGHRPGYFCEGPGLPWKQAIWPSDEMQKWEDHQAGCDRSTTVHDTRERATAPEVGKPKLLMRAFSVQPRRKSRVPRQRVEPQVVSRAPGLIEDGVAKPPPYTQEEKAWLREHYGEDFKFNGWGLDDDGGWTDGRRTMSLSGQNVGKKGIKRFGSVRIAQGMHRVTSLVGASARRSDSWARS